MYSQTEDRKWELEWQRSLPAPILSLCQVFILLSFGFCTRIYSILSLIATVFSFFLYAKISQLPLKCIYIPLRA